MNETGVYIHIPFCGRKCGYCDFISYAGKENLFESYTDALLNEITNCKELQDTKINTIFIGGGTPSVLPPYYIEKIMETLSRFSLNKNAEITIEANPNSLSAEKLAAYKRSRINRLSIGLQAWQDRLLKTLGRLHTREDFLNCFNSAVKAGFNNISADLIFSVPGQTLGDWLETIDEITKLSLTHISCYGLIIEENTPFYEEYKASRLNPLDDLVDRRMYHSAVDILNDKGFIQYEISNFARKGFQSAHNSVYWKRGDYIGFGPSAHSLYNNTRFENTSDLELYIKENGNPDSIRLSFTDLSQKDIMEEFMFLGLRMREGVNASEFYNNFGMDILDIYGDFINKNINDGLLIFHNDNYILTKRGIDISNMVMSDFLLD